MVAVVARYRIVADDGSCRGWALVEPTGGGLYGVSWCLTSRGVEYGSVDLLRSEEEALECARARLRADERLERVAE